MLGRLGDGDGESSSGARRCAGAAAGGLLGLPPFFVSVILRVLIARDWLKLPLYGFCLIALYSIYLL